MAVRYPLVLLDADDTLFDYPAGEAAAIEALFRGFGIGYDPKTHLPLYQLHNTAVWREYEAGSLTQPELGVERFRRLLEAMDLDQSLSVAMGESYLRHLSEGSQLLPGAVEACEALAVHCTLAIVTNGIPEVQHPRVRRSPLAPLLKAVVVSEEVGCRKPLPAIFGYTMSLCGYTGEPGNVLMVGDSLANDIGGARAAGLASCWYNPKGLLNGTPNIPDYEIGDLRDLVGIVLG